MTKTEQELAQGYVRKTQDIFDQLMEQAPENRKEWVKELWAKLIDAWNGVLLGNGAMYEFETALSIWSDLQLEVINLVRPAPKPKRQYKTRLTKMQDDFVDYYKQGASAAAAARKAGYSPKVARQIGYENLRKPHIARLLPVNLNKLT
jgi:hypothetical protein